MLNLFDGCARILGMRSILVILTLFALSSVALAQPKAAPKPEAKPPEPAIGVTVGVITDVNLRKRGVAFHRAAESLYGPTEVTDYFPLAEKATINLDGKSVELSKLRRDQVVTFLVDVKTGQALDVFATSRDEFDRRQKELAKEKDKRAAFMAAVEFNYDKIIRDLAAKAFAKEMAAANKAKKEALEKWKRKQEEATGAPVNGLAPKPGDPAKPPTDKPDKPAKPPADKPDKPAKPPTDKPDKPD